MSSQALLGDRCVSFVLSIFEKPQGANIVSTETAAPEGVSKETRTGLDPWKVAELPAPPSPKD